MKIKKFFLPLVFGCLIAFGITTQSCVSAPSKVEQKAEFKSINLWNNTHTAQIKVLVPTSWPNFFEKPYQVVNVVPFSPRFVGMQIVHKDNYDDLFVVGIHALSPTKLRVVNYGHKTKGWYIVDQKTGLPHKATPEEITAQVTSIVERDSGLQPIEYSFI